MSSASSPVLAVPKHKDVIMQQGPKQPSQQSAQPRPHPYKKFSEAVPTPVPLKAVNVGVTTLPNSPHPFMQYQVDSGLRQAIKPTSFLPGLRQAIKPTSFLPLPSPVTMRLYSQAYVDMFNRNKNMGFASYTDRETKERVQLFFHGSDYRAPETLTQTPPPRSGRSGQQRERVVQMAPFPCDELEFKVPERRDAIYYVLGENARGPCIAQWTTVLEYNEHLDYVAERFNLDLKIVLESPIYSLWITRPRSLGMHCNQATKNYEERYEWEEKLAWVGNNLHCPVLCETYIAAEAIKPACTFRWQQHNATYDAATGDWLVQSVDECESPVPTMQAA